MQGARTVRRSPLACAAAVAVAAGMLSATTAQAAGAALPFTSVEADSATTTGTRIGPDYTQGTLASEASGRQAVRLSACRRVGSQGHCFDPATGNTVTVALPAGTGLRYLRLNVTANTGWPAGQFSEVEAYPSS